MKYQVGDKVLLLHSEEEGIITDIINDKMVMVDVSGVNFPVYCDQIDFPYYKMFTAPKKPLPAKGHVDDIRREKQAPRVATGEGVFIRFIPVLNKDVFDDDIVEKLKVYLVNQNNEEYGFSYSLHFPDRLEFELKNTIRPASDFYLHDVDFEEMGDHPRFCFDFSLKENLKGKMDHFEYMLKIKGKQLFRKLEESRLKNEPSFSFLLFKEYPDKPLEDSSRFTNSRNPVFYDASSAASYLPSPMSVIDIHIEKIVNDTKGLNNAQILNLQLSHFEKYYESARAHHLPNLTVIHGVGEGVLRNEIHDRLKSRKGVKSFVNQYHPLYGFGATEIYFSY